MQLPRKGQGYFWVPGTQAPDPSPAHCFTHASSLTPLPQETLERAKKLLRSDTSSSLDVKLLTDRLVASIAATAPAQPAQPTPAVHTTPVIPEGKALVDAEELMGMRLDRARAEERERIAKEGTGPRPGMVEVRANKHTKGNRLLAMTPAPISHR